MAKNIRVRFNKGIVEDLPFKVRLSFHGIFQYWESLANSENPSEAAYGQSVLDKLAHAPELHQPITDPMSVFKYEEEVELLLSVLFPNPLQPNEIKVAGVPFTPILFNLSERFQQIISTAGKGFQLEMMNLKPDEQYVMACLFILNTYYKANIDYKRPFFFEIPNVDQGLNRFYRAFFNADFASFTLNKPDFHLSEADIKLLIDNHENVALWKEKIPPDTFDFEGFALITLFDITTDQGISELKTSLLNKDALVDDYQIENIQTQLQSIFNTPDLRFGYAFLDESEAKIKSLGHQHSSSLILSGEEEICIKHIMCDESYNMIFHTDKPLAFSDVEQIVKDSSDSPNPFLNNLLKQGIKSYLIAPIRQNGNTIGILEVGAHKAWQLNAALTYKLEDLLPMFSIALKRSLDDRKTALDAIVQNQFTAIHPAVSWRFYDAAEKLMEGQSEQIEEIVFEEVYPLFGQADIKGSSTERNKAIAGDLIEQLSLAKEVLDKASKRQSMPVLDILRFRLDNYINSVKQGLKADDEVSVLEFLSVEVYPVFNHLKNMSANLALAVKRYFDHLDPTLGILYKRRKDYEYTVSLINERVSDYLETEQIAAQEIFPHYFETYKTDGVEHHIYLGQSIHPSTTFDPMYLHNLRLWQLLVTCGIERLVNDLQSEMKVPLTVASLLLVHSSPLAIRFRMGEKQFDVDGAYNIRYSIIKKRIDKAHIKGTNERLTQPGKIALVYTQDKDAVDYRRYFEYLHAIGKVGPVIEDVELEELQGASGLRALRVDVVFDQSDSEKSTKKQLVKTR